jgi:hypothetical protein
MVGSVDWWNLRGSLLGLPFIPRPEQQICHPQLRGILFSGDLGAFHQYCSPVNDQDGEVYGFVSRTHYQLQIKS